MMTVLGSPQRRYECIHVLGTNGKTSTTRMTAAILERHGLHTAAYTSPHLISYRERVQIGEREIDGDQLAEARAIAASDGALELALSVARTHATKAADALDGADGLDATVCAELAHLVDGLVTRES